MSELDRSSLGAFLRSRRERIDPRAIGITTARRRRTAGLRREEVAELAGIGVDWYARLEQGRRVTPSTTTVDALARVLRLNADEHAHLRALVQQPGSPPFSIEQVPDVLGRIVTSLDQPAFVKGRRWDLLAWNAAAADVFVDFDALAAPDRNLIAFMFTNGEARRLFGDDWSSEARYVLAQFRLDHDLWAGDPAFRDLVDRVSATSQEFRLWWTAHDVRSAATGRKRLRSPDGRQAVYEYATFRPNGDPALRLAIYSPVPD